MPDSDGAGLGPARQAAKSCKEVLHNPLHPNSESLCSQEAVRTAALQLVSIAELMDGDPAVLLAPPLAYQPVGDDCALFIRKFPASLAEPAHELFSKYVL